MPAIVERRAGAKINLALHVVGRRASLYHELDTVAVFADVGDLVSVCAANDLSLSVEGAFAAQAPAGEENLVLKAARLLKTRMQGRAGAAIRLIKNLPAGAGFGGGSADAAAALRALADLWSPSLAHVHLSEIGERLGADVPMCLVGRALRARGVGERIEEIDFWPPLPLVLVWPGRAVSTAQVFGALQQRDNPPLPEPRPASTPAELAAWLVDCRNDLEAPALKLAPDIAQALASLRDSPGCLLTRMSGSGSACFGLYTEAAEAEAAASRIAAARPEWWVRAAMGR